MFTKCDFWLHFSFLGLPKNNCSLSYLYKATKDFNFSFIFRNISSAENTTVALLAFGEGWHNYHHTFPWDYKAAELGNYKLNLTTGIIDMFARIGWAYDLKTASPELVSKRMARTGDGTRFNHHSHENQVYGWSDKDMTAEDRLLVSPVE